LASKVEGTLKQSFLYDPGIRGSSSIARREPPIMSQSDDPTDPTGNIAPDLQILGDEITLQPSGYVEPSGVADEGREEALMHQFASFRAEPLQ
jgi:hypothetical protein